MGEFDLIDLIRRRVGLGGAGVSLGIGDDAAVLDVPDGQQLVVTTDTLNEGVHFFGHAEPSAIGHKALAVNLSDLAAMGAKPAWVLLSISLPEQNEAFVNGFLDGFLELAERFGVCLVGGDTCSGPLSITVTAMGFAARGEALTRSGARAGDLIVISGVPGRAALALSCLLAGEEPGEDALAALTKPMPRVSLGAALVGKATACVDISDGLLADLGHIADASGCGAVIDLESLPFNDELAACEEAGRWRLQLSGGDDYELCFTLPPGKRDELAAVAGKTGLCLGVIGRMDESDGIRCIRADGSEFEAQKAGYEHFR